MTVNKGADESDGTTLGQDSDSLVGFHGKVTAIHTTAASGQFAGQAGGSVNQNSVWDGGLIGATGKGYYSVHDIVRALKDHGILALDGGISIS